MVSASSPTFLLSEYVPRMKILLKPSMMTDLCSLCLKPNQIMEDQEDTFLSYIQSQREGEWFMEPGKEVRVRKKDSL